MPEFREGLQAALQGRYSLEREINAGSMAVVYRALDIRHGRTVAIKALRPEYLGAIEGERFLREIRVAARLQHPHILPLFDSGEAAGGLFYVMPFVEGATLRELLRRDGTMKPQAAVELAREVCDALAYAHRNDVLHRDVKPENIMISDGHALVGDFGIARALHVATTGQVTGAGHAIGTLPYMSPEQASGERELTEQSDIYSLGCVIYEMLTGVTPHAATSGRSLLAARLTTTPRDPSTIRADLPHTLTAVVMRTLALDPAERHASADILSAELAAAIAPLPVPVPRWRKLALSGVAAVLLSGALLYNFLWGSRQSPVNPDLFIVLPFADGGTRALGELDGDDVARLVTDALQRWRGVNLADDMRVRDAVSRRNGQEFTLADALATARGLGAGRLVWGVVSEADAGVDVRLSVFDTAKPKADPLARSRRVLGPRAVVVDSIATMTDEAITRVAGGGADARPAGTRNAGALRAYLAGQARVNAYDLDSAAALFELAVRLDSTFARAFYWRAQTLAWQASDGDPSWEVPATRAIALGDALSTRERTLALSLLALARRQFAVACTRYASMIARDSLDFEAWFGQGECLLQDNVVVPDPSSPSGWRFRSSAHAAVTAYARSLNLAPSFLSALGGTAIARLERLLLATPNDISVGYAVAESLQFAAYPGLEGDTISRIPWPASDFLAGKPGTRPRSYVAAIDHNRNLLRGVTAAWVRQNPRLAVAHAHLALALENLAKLDTIGSSESALGEILRARALPHARADSIRFAGIHLRLLVKLGRADAAKSLADSLLSFGTQVTSEQAKIMASAAALTGRLRLATLLLRAWTRGELVWTPRGTLPFPASVAGPAMGLAVYASAGGSSTTVGPMIERTEQAIDALARDDVAPELRRALLDVPAALAYPATAVTNVHRTRHRLDRYLGMQWALSRRDTAGVRARLDSLEREAADDRPGDAGMEYVLIEARLHLALGDSAMAQRVLEAALGSLPDAGRILTEEVTSVGSLLQLWLLHSAVATARGDAASAVRSAKTVATLWRDADVEIAPVAAQARSVAGIVPDRRSGR
ncbi:MAG: Serine/threonine-protein kinase PknD [Gemmatimonadaceae bacterium]|nr:Serine/threonine-protein kinase PknD [Gemmatimonadaceae bacterium]